ncbi:hypothetical protein SHDE107825_05210 [Shewanella denitrificans]
MLTIDNYFVANMMVRCFLSGCQCICALASSDMLA